jgi:hypothetical protein
MSDKKIAEFTIDKEGNLIEYHGIQPEYLQFFLSGDDSMILNGDGEDEPVGLLSPDDIITDRKGT